MSNVTIERDGRIAIVTFDRGFSANPLSLDLMRDLTAAARSFEDDAEVSAVVLSGRSDNFSMGFDLKDSATTALREAGLAERRLALQAGGRMCRAWAEIEALTVSAMEGWCVGGGLALAVSTDLRVMAADAQIYVPEIERGLNMSWGSVPRITNLIGPARAKRLVVLAEKLNADQALAWGLVDKVTGTSETTQTNAIEGAMSFAEKAAALPPVALRMCKQSIDAYANALAHTASHSDYDQFALSQEGDDYAEGVAAFLEGRPPHYTGR